MNSELDRRIKAALDADRPPEVFRVLVHSGNDSTGAPAVWIYLVLVDEQPSAQLMDRLAAWATKVLPQDASPAWPYIRFRTRTEQTEVERMASSPK